MNLQELTSPLPKPWLNINANQLNGGSPYATFNGICAGFTGSYTLGTPISGSTSQLTQISIPSSYWTLSDCKVTYNGPSGLAFFYGAGCGFFTDTAGSYNFSAFVNGSAVPFNLSVVRVAIANTLITGSITGTRIFNTGDYLQLVFDKGTDIIGAPVVSVGGMGFNLFRVG